MPVNSKHIARRLARIFASHGTPTSRGAGILPALRIRTSPRRSNQALRPHQGISGLALFALALGWASAAFPQTITIQGSPTLAALDRQWAEAYMRKHPGMKIQVAVNGASAAFAALREPKANLVIVSRLMRYQEAESCQTVLGQRPAECKVGVNGLAVYVNAANPVRVLTYDELYGIFRGKYTNWKDLGGRDAPIRLYGQGTNCAVGELFVEEVLNGKEPAGTLRSLPDAELLSAIGKDPNSIGYGAVAQAQGVCALAIKRAFSSTPVEPTEEAIADRTYPISRYLYSYINPAAGNGVLQTCLDWLRGDEGQRVAKAAGFYPLPPKLRASR